MNKKIILIVGPDPYLGTTITERSPNFKINSHYQIKSEPDEIGVFKRWKRKPKIKKTPPSHPFSKFM